MKTSSNDAVADAQRAIAAEIRMILLDLERDIRAEMADLSRDENKIERTVENARKLRSIIDGLRARIEGPILSALGDVQSSELNGLVDVVLAEADKLGIDGGLDDITQEDIRLLLDGNIKVLESMSKNWEVGIERILARSITGTVDWDDLSTRLGATIETTGETSGAVVGAAIAGFHTQVRTEYFDQEDEDGNPLVTWWLYSGPDDARTRDFCSHFVGTRVTLDQLDEHADDFERTFPAPPSVSLGGYNCRHELIPLVDQEDIDRYPIGPTK